MQMFLNEIHGAGRVDSGFLPVPGSGALHRRVRQLPVVDGVRLALLASTFVSGVLYWSSSVRFGSRRWSSGI